MPVGFGVVGCGMISRFHAEAIAHIEGAKLIGCFNDRHEGAQKFAQERDCIAYKTLEEMLANPEIQVVTICTPSGAHLEPAVEAANAGKHLLVEKPLEITLERCDAIIEACKKNGVKLGAILPSRFGGANIALKQAIEAGRFGKLTLGDTYVKWWRSQEYYDGGGWRGTWAMDGGGAYMNQAIHNVDLLYWFMGEIESVSAVVGTLAHERIEVEDTGVAAIRFANGALGTITATTSAWPGLLKKTEIHGDAGSVIVEQDDILMWEFQQKQDEDDEIAERFAKKSGNTGGASDPSAISFQGHQDQFEDFIDAINNGTEPLIDGEQGRKSVEIILAIYQSSWTGKQVKLPLESDPKRPE